MKTKRSYSGSKDGSVRLLEETRERHLGGISLRKNTDSLFSLCFGLGLLPSGWGGKEGSTASSQTDPPQFPGDAVNKSMMLVE